MIDSNHSTTFHLVVLNPRVYQRQQDRQKKTDTSEDNDDDNNSNKR